MAELKFLVDLDVSGNIDLNDNQLLNMKLQHLSSDPTGVEGQLYYNSSSNVVKFYDGSDWVTFSSASGDITAVVAGNGLTGGATSGSATVTVGAGTGITVNTNDVAVTAAQTGITSITNTSLNIGRGNDNLIKFGTDNEITFRVSANDGVVFKASGEIEATKFDGALEGNADTATVATTVTITDNESTNETNAVIFTAGGAKTGGNLGLESDGDLTYNPSSGTLAATAFTGNLTGNVTGTASTATVATTVTITDNESTDEDNPIVFVAGGDVDGGNLGLETDGNAHYNPSTGKITATAFAGNLTGNVTGNASGSSGSCTGNAATATALATGRNINGVSFDGTGNITVTAAGSTLSDTVTVAKGGTGATSFADKSVIITQDSGTDTLAAVAMTTSGQLLIGGSSGPAVATLTAGSNITITNSDGGISIAGTANDDVSVANLKTALAGGFGSNAVTIGDSNDVVTIGNDLTVTGDLIVSGDTTTVNTATLSVEDPLIVLASGNGADSVDVGFYAKYTSSGAKYTGLFRDASDSNTWKLFATSGNSHAAPTTTVDTSSGFTYGNLRLGTLTGDVTGDLTGNADTATALATARNIGGVSFDGTGNINLPGVNTSGSQDTSGNAATATALATARNINGVSFDGTGNITVTAAGSTLSDTVTVAKGGTGATSLTDGGILLGSGTGAVTAMAVLADGEMIVGDGTTDPVAESGATLRTSIGVGPTAGNTSLVTTGTITTGTWAATDVAVAHGGTGASSAADARTNLGVAYASDAEALAGSSDTVVLTPGNLAARSYKTTIGDGSDLDIAVTHSLGTRDVIVQLYDSSSYETVYAQVVRTDANTVTIDTNAAAASGDITVLITKVD